MWNSGRQLVSSLVRRRRHWKRELFEAYRSALIYFGSCPPAYRRIPASFAEARLGYDRIIRVATAEVRYKWDWTGTTLGHRYFVMDGDWDDNRSELGIHPTVHDMFVRGLPYRHTRQYAHMVAGVGSGDYGRAYWCRTVPEVDAYFERLVSAFSAIRQHGYRTQAELGRGGLDEIRVVIDRNGGILQGRGGNHRLAIAKVLGIETVPVLVHGVHYEWARRCVARHRRSVIESIRRELARIDRRTAAQPIPGRDERSLAAN